MEKPAGNGGFFVSESRTATRLVGILSAVLGVAFLRGGGDNDAVLRYTLSNGCFLRLFEERDAEELDRVVAANRDHLAPWLPWVERTGGVDDRLAYIRRGRRRLADNEGFDTAVIAEGSIVGSVGFSTVDWDNRSASIGYWLAEGQQGRGTMTDAVRALTDFAFDVWQLVRVEIRVAVGNERSAAIPRRLGFVEEGLLHRAERHGNGFKDLRVFAKLAQPRERLRTTDA